MPLAEIRERGKRLKIRMVIAGHSSYATKYMEWSPSLSEITNAQDRIRQIGVGRGRASDLDLLRELERITDRKLGKTT